VLDNKRVLVLSPHIDDAEFGCGGTIDKLIKQGSEVKYLAFSDCRDSIPDTNRPTILRDELEDSVKVLGVQSHEICDFKVRRFDQERQNILQLLIDVKQTFNPEIVLTPSTKDIHQDHQVVTNECIRAFKHCTIIGYELPWNCLALSSNNLIKLSEENLNQKVASLMCYSSQQHRIYHNPEYIRSLALTRGLRIGDQYAEAFEMIRLILD